MSDGPMVPIAPGCSQEDTDEGVRRMTGMRSEQQKRENGGGDVTENGQGWSTNAHF